MASKIKLSDHQKEHQLMGINRYTDGLIPAFRTLEDAPSPEEFGENLLRVGNKLYTCDGIVFREFLTSFDTIAPTVPTNLTATPVSPNRIDLTWTASEDATGVAGYKIYRNGFQVAVNQATSYSDTNLVENTLYTYTVSAFDFAGNSFSQSTAASAITLDSDTTAPTVPANLVATALSTTSIGLAWSASTDESGVFGYKIYRNSVFVGSSTTTSFTDSALTAGTLYSYTVTAFDLAGNESAQSAADTATTNSVDVTAPSVPAGLAATVTGASSIDLAWTASTDAVGVTGYKIYRDSVLITTVPTTIYSDTGLEASTLYSYTVTAIDAAGNESAESTADTATTSSGDDIIAPTVPANLAAVLDASTQLSMIIGLGTPITAPSTGSATQINVSWDASTDAVGVAGYRLYRDSVLITTTTALTYADVNVVGNTTYLYAVAAFDAAGNTSARSATVSVTTSSPADTTAPTIPTSLTASPISTSQIDLAWTASTDAIGVAGYKVYRQIASELVVGLVGASMTVNAVEGAETLGSTRFWNSIGSGDSTGDQSTSTAVMSNFILIGDPASTGGATWTYTSTDNGVNYNLKGNLFKPSGAGPFPGMILSHGFGSTAPNGNSFRATGLVTIGTNYTHSSDTTGLLPAGDEGASTANMQRAHKAWDILKGLGYVDMSRVGAHGHSMGAFVTAALVGTYPNDFKTATHTAGGVNDSNVPWTKTAQANGITIPYLMQHGTNDNTVPIADDRALRDILLANGVTHQLIEYPGLSHSDMINQATHPEIQAAVLAWHNTHGLYTSSPSPYSGGGLYQWARDLSNTNSYWNAFTTAWLTQPTQTFWFELCAIDADAVNETFDNALRVVNNIKSRVPGAIVYVSAQPDYSPSSHECGIAGTGGQSRMATIRDQLVSAGHCLLGPVQGPLAYPSQTLADGCHANTAGKAVLGQQIINFFDAITTDFIQIGTSIVTSYSDTGLGAGLNYSYKVAAYDAANNTSALSGVATATTTTVASTAFEGFYVIDGANGVQTTNDPATTTALAKPYIDGLLYRIDWAQLETSQGVYNFTKIANKLAYLPEGKKLSLVIFAVAGTRNGLPAYIMTRATSDGQTWNAGQYGVNPLPWHAFTLERWDAFCLALSNFVVDGVALKDHPKLANIDCSLPGCQGIRLASLPPGYTAQTYKTSCIAAVTSMATRFVNKHCYVGLFGIGGQSYPQGFGEAQAIRDQLLALFNGNGTTLIKFFQETWTGKVPEITSNQGKLVYEVRDITYTGLQSCWRWSQQSTGTQCNWATADTPQKGFEIAALFGTVKGVRYFELYLEDVNIGTYDTTFQTNHDLLFP